LPERSGYSFGPIGNLKLLEYWRPVSSNGAFGHPEALADLLVQQTLARIDQDLATAEGQSAVSLRPYGVVHFTARKSYLDRGDEFGGRLVFREAEHGTNSFQRHDFRFAIDLC
jgi:hypothetical protein